MLRDFEDVIEGMTRGKSFEHPRRDLMQPVARKMAHGCRLSFFRPIVLKRHIEFDCDFLWIPLMGPEDFQLDLFKGWDRKARYKILYLFDTFPHQYKLIKKITHQFKFDLLVTSFEESVSELTKVCDQRWHCVPQGVRLERFYPRYPAAEERPPIQITAYGRRDKDTHAAVKKFCQEHQFWYDYTSAKNRELSIPAAEYYQIYAAHLGSSYLSFNWAVEFTHPQRAGGISAITCRWFEAAASGCVLVGKAPKCSEFKKIFGGSLVHEVPEEKNMMEAWLKEFFEAPQKYRELALSTQSKLKDQWTWQSRVKDILRLISHS